MKKNLILTRPLFLKLMEHLLRHFFKADPERKRYKMCQRYGFKGYDPQLPSLKQELEQLSGFYVNGKYLYSKMREAERGKPFIKLNKEYRFLVFKYLGYSDVIEFLQQPDIPKKDVEKQLKMLRQEDVHEKDFYVSYYYGEMGKIICGQVTVYNNWANMEIKFIYPAADKQGNDLFYTHYGRITERNGLLHVSLKLHDKDKQENSGYMIFFVGKTQVYNRLNLLGVYAGFDMDNQPVCGKIFMEKTKTRHTQVTIYENKNIDAAVIEVIKNKRMAGLNFLPSSTLHLSPESPFQKQIHRYVGTGMLVLMSEHNEFIDRIKLNIDPVQLEITSNSDNVIYYNSILLAHQGQVLTIHFQVLGSFEFTEVIARLNADAEPGTGLTGYYTAVDKKNRAKGGKVIMLFDSAVEPLLLQNSEKKA